MGNKNELIVAPKINDLVIATQDDLVLGYEYARDVKDYIDGVKEHFAPMKKKAHEAHKEITTKEKNALKEAEKFEKIIKDKIKDYCLNNDYDKISGLSERNTKDYEIKVKDLSQVPIEYLTLNEKAIKEVIKATKGTVKINGISYKEVTKTSITIK